MPRLITICLSAFMVGHPALLAAQGQPPTAENKPDLKLVGKPVWHGNWMMAQVNELCAATLTKNGPIMMFMASTTEGTGTLYFSGPDIPSPGPDGRLRFTLQIDEGVPTNELNVLAKTQDGRTALALSQSDLTAIENFPNKFRVRLLQQGKTIFDMDVSGFADSKRWLFECAGKAGLYKELQLPQSGKNNWLIRNDGTLCSAVSMPEADKTKMLMLARVGPERLSFGVINFGTKDAPKAKMKQQPGTYKLGNANPAPVKFDGELYTMADGSKGISYALVTLNDLSILDLPDDTIVTLTPDGTTPYIVTVKDMRAAGDYALNCKTPKQMMPAAQ